MHPENKAHTQNTSPEKVDSPDAKNMQAGGSYDDMRNLMSSVRIQENTRVKNLTKLQGGGLP